MKSLEIIKSQIGIQKLKELGGEIFLVGGCVRDHFLNKESKDIDIIVRLLDDTTITTTLSKFGIVDKVGESFGVIKFKPFDWVGEPIDIALPRIDKLIDKSLGHLGIKAEFDKNISIENDLERRDFTINSIAVSLDGTIIDPFCGLDDIKSKIIKATSPKAFTEDPLRMLRAIQFSSRFGFKISDDTWKMILDNKEDIKLISGERIIEELDKIFFKGDIKLGLKLFEDSGLHKHLFGERSSISSYLDIRTREDFYFVISHDSKEFKSILKGDNDTEKGISAISKCFHKQGPKVIDGEFTWSKEISEIRQDIFDSIQTSKTVLDSAIIESIYPKELEEFKSGKLPNSTKDLSLNGFDLMELGFKGPQIGERQKLLLSEIFADRRTNTKEDLIK